MATDDGKVAIEALRKRAEMRSAGEEELSAVIQQEALLRAQARQTRAPSSLSAPAKGIVAILNMLPPGRGRVIVVCGILGLMAFAIERGIKLWFLP